MADDMGAAGGEAEIDFNSAPPPESFKGLPDEAWAATPPDVRKAIYERESRSKTNHGEQIGRLAGELNALKDQLAQRAATNGNGHETKKPGIEGMELSELEAYHDRAEGIREAAEGIRWKQRSNPDAALSPDEANTLAQAAKLTPAVMRELSKAINKKSLGVDKSELDALRAEIRGDKEAARLNGALTQKVVAEFGAASVMAGNATKLAAEKAYGELQAAIKDGLSPEAALQYAAYKIAASGNRDGRTNGVDANGARRSADNGSPDVAAILRSLKTKSAALRAKGDSLGAAMADVEADLYGTMPDNILNNGR